LYPYLLYFDPSDYSINSIYPPKHQQSAPLIPAGVLHIAHGPSLVRPLKLHVRLNEEYDVGYLRLFVSTSPLPMGAIQQASVAQTDRHVDEIEYPSVWNVQTIVVRVDRDTSTPDVFGRVS